MTHVESVVCLTRRLDNELPMASIHDGNAVKSF